MYIDGNVVCITGELRRYSRKKAQRIIEEFGGIFKNTMSNKVDIFVIADSCNNQWTTKMEKAQHNEHLITISENEFYDLVSIY